jgi:folate-binding protein YgfZ
VEEHHPVYAVSAHDSGDGQPDPRHPALGRRAFEKPAGMESPFAAWDENRIRHAVPDGSRDMAVERDTPLDCNLERFDAIAFGKGCYVGQEVTARMNYRGLVKKHLYPVQWHDGAPPVPFSDLHVNGMLAGQMRGACGRIGLAQLKDDMLAKLENAPFTVLSTPD